MPTKIRMTDVDELPEIEKRLSQTERLLVQVAKGHVKLMYSMVFNYLLIMLVFCGLIYHR